MPHAATDRGLPRPRSPRRDTTRSRHAIRSVVADRHRHVADLVGSLDVRAARCEQLQCRRRGMTISIAGAHAHERPLGPEHREQPRRDRFVASVMSDLEHVDVAQDSGLHERLEHTRLSVAREQRRERPVAHEHHDTGFVGGGVVDRLARGQHRGSESPAPERCTGNYLVAGLPATCRGDLCQCRGLGVKRPGRHDDQGHSDETRESGQPPVVIGVQVGDHDGVNASQACSRDRSAQDPGRRSGVDEHRMGAITQQDRVALTDIEHLDRGSRDDLGADGQRGGRHDEADGRPSRSHPRRPRPPTP